MKILFSNDGSVKVRPAAATPADLAALASAGLSTADIVTVSQLVAFVSYHARLFVGLALLRRDERAASRPRIGPRDAPNAGFTQEEIGWTPWLAPFEAADATPEQLTVLSAARTRSSRAR